MARRRPAEVEEDLEGGLVTPSERAGPAARRRGEDDPRGRPSRCFGAFTRNVELPTTADLDHIDAECCNGVLKIIVDKVPTAKSKKIDVKTASPMIAEA